MFYLLGIVSGVIVVLIIILIVIITTCWKKRVAALTKTQIKPKVILAAEKVRANVIFKKGADLKNILVSTTDDEKKIFEEFIRLEAEVFNTITHNKTTEKAHLEDNAKHNRYTDIGQDFYTFIRNV